METQQQSVRQSRIGKRAVELPKGVEVNVKDGQMSVKGPKGTLSRALPPDVKLVTKDGFVHVEPARTDLVTVAQNQGLARALVKNMIEGVSKGYATSMDLYGVGYRAEVKGQELTLALGLSHQVKLALPKVVAAKVEIIDEGGTKRPRLHLASHDKEALGQTAAHIKSFRPPEPYKGKGVRFTGEKIRQKAGKAGAKGKK